MAEGFLHGFNGLPHRSPRPIAPIHNHDWTLIFNVAKLPSCITAHRREIHIEQVNPWQPLKSVRHPSRNCAVPQDSI
jgi:hypothetical protein